jgi:hypothetical protein
MELCVVHNTLFKSSMLRAITVPPGETVGRLSLGAKNRPLFERPVPFVRRDQQERPGRDNQENLTQGPAHIATRSVAGVARRRKEKADLTEGHKAASPRPNTKKSFTQEGHKGRKEIPYQEFKTGCSVSIRFVFATFAALL